MFYTRHSVTNNDRLKWRIKLRLNKLRGNEVIRSCSTTGMKENIILCHVDPLLGNDRETSNCTAVVARQRLRHQALTQQFHGNKNRKQHFLRGPCRDVIRTTNYTYVRTYSIFGSVPLRINIKVPIYKALIRSLGQLCLMSVPPGSVRRALTS
jgi:hypothetical protein